MEMKTDVITIEKTPTFLKAMYVPVEGKTVKIGENEVPTDFTMTARMYTIFSKVAVAKFPWADVVCDDVAKDIKIVAKDDKKVAFHIYLNDEEKARIAKQAEDKAKKEAEKKETTAVKAETEKTLKPRNRA